MDKAYIEEQYYLAVLDFKIAQNEKAKWKARKNMARLQQLAAQVYGFSYADKLHSQENL